MSKNEKQTVNCDVACRLRTSIGGQALIEGIMMRGPKTTAMAVRDPKGEIVMEEWPTTTKKRARVLRLPVVRGIFNFVDTMRFGYKCLMRSAEIAGLDEVTEQAPVSDEAVNDAQENASLPTEEKKKEEPSWMMSLMMVIASILGIGLAIVLFVWLPSQIYAWLPDSVFPMENRYLKSVFEGVCKMLLLVGYMAAVSLMKDIRRTYMYHGAEHKTIFCYEAGLELTVENVRRMRRFHPRCGTSFLMLMVLVSILIGFFIPPAWPTLLRALVKLILIPLTVGIGYELIKLAGRHDNVLTRIISAPGLLLQRLTVYEPEDAMIECAIAAMKRAIPDDGSDKI